MSGLLTWPTLASRQQQRLSDQVGAAVSRIGVALQLYAAAYNHFPQKLSELHPEFIKDLGLFASPFDPEKVKRAEDIDDPAKTNLVYVPGRRVQGLSSDVLLYEVRPTRLTETMVIGESSPLRVTHHALFLNNEIRGVSPAFLLRQLQGIQGLTPPASSAGGENAVPGQ
jgi:hypothetical protein